MTKPFKIMEKSDNSPVCPTQQVSHLRHRLLPVLPHKERHALPLHQHRPDHQIVEWVLKEVLRAAGVDQVRYGSHHTAHNTRVAAALKVQKQKD